MGPMTSKETPPVGLLGLGFSKSGLKVDFDVVVLGVFFRRPYVDHCRLALWSAQREPIAHVRMMRTGFSIGSP